MQPRSVVARPKSMRLLRILLVMVLPSCLVVLAAPAPPAAACSCVGGDASDFAEWADTVFVGTLDEVTTPLMAPVFSSTDTVTYEFSVGTVYEGEARERTHVQSVRSGASCGLEGLVLQHSYVVFAAHRTIDGEPSEALWANLCGGTAPASKALVADVEAVLGSGAAPQPGVTGAPGHPLASVLSSLTAWASRVIVVLEQLG